MSWLKKAADEQEVEMDIAHFASGAMIRIRCRSSVEATNIAKMITNTLGISLQQEKEGAEAKEQDAPLIEKPK